MKVIDSFSFFNEFDILKLRLNYLKDVVDYFVICEANCTYSGEKKMYYLDAILHELPEEIKSKIISIHYEPDVSSLSFDKSQTDMGSDFWKLERSQREFITQHLTQFQPDDLFMVSDVDEIPNKNLIRHIQSHSLPQDFCASVDCDVFYYNFHTHTSENWKGTVISTVAYALQMGCDYFRANRYNLRAYEKGGFHFSFFGGVNKIKHKIHSFAHQEYNDEEYTNHILEKVNSKTDLFNRNITFSSYDFNQFPQDLQDCIVSIFPKHYITK